MLLKNNLVGNNTNINTQYLRDIIQLKEIQELRNKNYLKEAFEKLNDLSGTFKQKKKYPILQLEILSVTSKKEHTILLNNLLNSTKNNPGIYLLSIELFFINRKYNEFISSINKLDEIVNGDPLLNLYRANAYYKMEDYSNALKYFKLVESDFGELSYGYVGTLLCLTETEKYKEAIHMIYILISRFRLSLEQIEGIIKEKKEFMTSEVYTNWKNN